MKLNLYINVKMLINVNVLPTPYQKEKRLKNLKISMTPQVRTTIEKESEEGKNCLSKQNVR
jgi:hypothetical protein